MTAEIALLNRRALAFAADSAVTISDGTNDKIYNSAEKIFELSRKVPLGLMLYNTTEFVGVPLDVLVRKFRSDCDERFDDARDACRKLVCFLEGFDHSIDDEGYHLRSVMADEITIVVRESRKEHEKLTSALDFSDSDKIVAAIAKMPGLPRQAYVNVITRRCETYEANPLDNFLPGISIDEFTKRYTDYIEPLIKPKVKQFPVDADIVTLFMRLAWALVKSTTFSGYLTGVVVGGYGKECLFPTLYSVELDGVYFGTVKQQIVHEVKIDRKTNRSEIIPFAQSEMVERFLYGIDADLESSIVAFLRRSANKITKTLEGAGVDVASIGVDASSYTGDIEKFIERLKKKSRDETYSMVDFMPKQELSYTAEAFVSLTSIKRKVSAQQETVGGPVDVAIITRNEGFVWIKRKHYFNTELNPGYKVRTFDKPPGGQNGRAPKKV